MHVNDQLNDFIHYLTVEKGLAKNTIDSYRRDLKNYLNFIGQQLKITDLNHVTRTHIMQFLNQLKNEGKSSKTIARHIASIRSFHHFLLIDKVTENDPTIHIETPQAEMKLPKVLHPKEVDKLLNTPDLTTPLGIRDKAMLELMYATGMRVSELISLQLNDVHLSLGFVRCIGKGNKERIIPIGKLAQEALEHYLNKARPKLCSKKSNRHFIFKPSWQRINETRFLENFKTNCSKSRDRTEIDTTYITSFFCNPFAGKWCRFAVCPRNARTRRYFNNANLYACNKNKIKRCV